MVVELPSNEEEVRQVIAACHELKVPVVARGAGTGLSGGALPMGDGVLLSLAKMRRILALDPVARTARVQPGVTKSTRLNSSQAEDTRSLCDWSSDVCSSDRKSTRLNSSHTVISYAVFCLRSEEHTSELQSHSDLVCRLLLEKKKCIRMKSILTLY